MNKLHNLASSQTDTCLYKGLWILYCFCYHLQTVICCRYLKNYGKKNEEKKIIIFDETFMNNVTVFGLFCALSVETIKIEKQEKRSCYNLRNIIYSAPNRRLHHITANRVYIHCVVMFVCLLFYWNVQLASINFYYIAQSWR